MLVGRGKIGSLLRSVTSGWMSRKAAENEGDKYE